jgi:hypothetical protein
MRVTLTEAMIRRKPFSHWSVSHRMGPKGREYGYGAFGWILPNVKRLQEIRATLPPWATASAACTVDRQSPGGVDYCGNCDGAESPDHCRIHGLA